MKDTFAFSDNVFGVVVDSEIDQAKMEEIRSHLEERIRNNSFINLYIEDEHSKGMSISGLLECLSFHFSNSGSIKRVAIVTNLKWFQKTMNIKGLLIKAEVETFDLSQRMEAMNWVME